MHLVVTDVGENFNHKQTILFQDAGIAINLRPFITLTMICNILLYYSITQYNYFQASVYDRKVTLPAQLFT